MSSTTVDSGRSHRPAAGGLRKRMRWLAAGVLVLFVAILFVFSISPWPMALLIRYVFDLGSASTTDALQKHVPEGISSVLDQPYRAGDPDGYLDVYYPSRIEGTDETLPTIVWVHGGGWVSGNKSDAASYLKILASQGYTTVSIGYSIAPGQHYPLPVIQLNDALAYVQENAQRLHIDADRIVLGGSSAGAHITAQLATAITSPAYAESVGIAPTLPPARLVGMLLNCGPYDPALVDFDGAFAPVLRGMLWAYSGTRNFLNDPNFLQATVTANVTADYPPSFITVGNADPLEEHSHALAQRLAALDVEIDTLFYPPDHEPALPHEYQFNLDSDDGQIALARTVAFLEAHARAPLQE